MTVRHLWVPAIMLLPAAAVAQTPRDESLRVFLASSFAEIRESSPDATYVAAFADLNGDGRDEALVWQSANFFCGSGGCALYVYTSEGESWREVNEFTIAGPPVLQLTDRTRGWSDLALVVRDSGIDFPYQVRVRFNGTAYGGSAMTRVRTRARLDGRILIADGMPSRRLFQ